MTTLENLGRLVQQKRGDQGIRGAAKEIGIGHATLSRVERGRLPDLENYQKICAWLGVEMSTLTGVKPTRQESSIPQVHFRKKPTISAKTAQALAQLILAAQADMLSQEESL